MKSSNKKMSIIVKKVSKKIIIAYYNAMLVSRVHKVMDEFHDILTRHIPKKTKVSKKKMKNKMQMLVNKDQCKFGTVFDVDKNDTVES